jgi:acyl-coenzyme A thioesterase PaaI-like protein
MSLKSFLFKKKLNIWPPFLGAGVRVTKVAPDFTSFDVEMKLRKWNRNRVGIHYGGSLYTMTDAFFGTILGRNLGSNYIVVDKESSIKYKKPGTGKVTAHFNISAARIAEIKKQADDNYKVEPSFKVDIKDEAGNTIAEVEKLLYVRRKDKKPIHGYKPPQA